MRRKTIFAPKLTSNEIEEFENLVKTNMKRAYFSALGFVGTHDVAVELSQQAFIRAYRSFRKFDQSKNFFTWYYKILKNLCLNYIRDSKKSKNQDFLENIESKDDGINPQKIIEQEELKQIIQESLLSLSEAEREIIILKEFQNTTYKEIAELLNIPIGTVMSRLFYARKKLANKLGEL